MKRIFSFALAAVLVLSFATTGCRSGTNSDPDGDKATLDLAGSKQGQSIGFVDVDGDGIMDKVVGAPYSFTDEGRIGSVLVYKATASGYTTIPNITLTGDDNFGYSFVNLGDADGDAKDDFAVGAIHGDGDEVSLSGSVTIYKGGAGGRIIKKISGEGPLDKFGTSLAAGDVNGDGTSDIIVGAPFNTNDPALYQSGAVYIFFGPSFTSSARLYASSANKGIGWAVASGDINNDGVSDVLVSAGGKVLVYFGGASFAPSTDSPDITLTGSVSGFGKAIAVIGDIDGDGKREIAVGAPGAVINNNRDTGSVYVVRGAASGTINVSASPAPAELIVRIDGEDRLNRFGFSIAPLGDFDGDGMADFAIGAPMSDVTTATSQNILSGKVYVYTGADISGAATIGNSAVFTGAVRDQAYGTCLAVNNDGKLLVGSPRVHGDAGGVDIVDPETGQSVSGGSSGGSTGDDGGHDHNH